MANRLNQSINEDGSLKTTAIDNALHSLEEHTDTDDYVRMTKAESSKLANVTDDASDVVLQIDTDGSTIVLFDSGVVIFESSTTVTPSVTAPNKVKFNLAFPAEAAHRHFYGLAPVHADQVTPDYVNYKVNASATPFVEESLRVYINGVRIFETDEVYVPGALVTDPWTLLSLTPDHDTGTFELSAAISDDDIIKIDFDISFV